LSALLDLASDYALKADIDVDYLVAKALLKSSLAISTFSFSVVEERVKLDYEWLFDLIDNNAH
jgi:hypothetical protein